MKHGIPIMASLALVALTPALAQEAPKPVQGYIQGGYAATTGETSDYLNGGFSISGGVILRPAHKASGLGIRFDLGWNYFGATSNLINLAQNENFRIDSGDGSVGSLTGDILYEFHQASKVGFHISAGIGGYHRYVQLTETALVGGSVCDPWWGYCYPAVGTGDIIVASKSTTKFGFNGGLGVDFHLGNGSTVYVEARYHWVDTSHATEYIPIVVGYQF